MGRTRVVAAPQMIVEQLPSTVPASVWRRSQLGLQTHGQTPYGTHIVNSEPQCASMRAGFARVSWPTSPHASALRLNALECGSARLMIDALHHYITLNLKAFTRILKGSK